MYGVALGGWASNNRWALLGGIRATAQMISYEIAMGLAIIAIVMTYGTLDLQEMVRMQGGVWFGWLPRWGIFVQPVAFILLLDRGNGGIQASAVRSARGRIRTGRWAIFIEYSGGKQAAFMLTDLAEQALVAMLLVTFFFGGWQVPWLYRDGFHLPGGAIVAIAPLLVSIAGIVAFLVKVVMFCLFMGLIRWTLPRFRYDQLMQLGWKVLVPLGLANILITAFIVVVSGGAH